MAFANKDTRRANLKRYFIKKVMKGRKDWMSDIKPVTGIGTKVTLAPDFHHQVIYDTAGDSFWMHIGTTASASAHTDWAELL